MQGDSTSTAVTSKSAWERCQAVSAAHAGRDRGDAEWFIVVLARDQEKRRKTHCAAIAEIDQSAKAASGSKILPVAGAPPLRAGHFSAL